MATSSFKEDLVVSDEKKAEEIARALRLPRDKTVQSARPEKLPKDASAVWFKHTDKS